MKCAAAIFLELHEKCDVHKGIFYGQWSIEWIPIERLSWTLHLTKNVLSTFTLRFLPPEKLSYKKTAFVSLKMPLSLSRQHEYILYCMIIRILREFIRKLWNAASNCNVIHFRTCVMKKIALSRHLRYESEEQKNTCDRMGVTWISGSDWKTFSLFFTALCLKYNRWGANSVSAHLI